METSFCFMAFGSGKASADSPVIKRYIGVAPVSILAVNPNKARIEEIYGTSLDKEPEYLSTNQQHDVPQVRIDFFVKTDMEKCGVELVNKVSFFLVKKLRFNRDETKVQVIDKYGRTCWVTKEQFQNREIPVYSNGPANIDKDYRACYIGEEDLTNFIKVYLNIPNVMRYVNNSWILVDNPADSEARLDKIDNYFNGNFSELESCIKLQPNNRIKAMFGVRTTEDNRQYQTIYTQMFLRNNARPSDYEKLLKDLNERKAAGALTNTEFSICDLKEYVIEPTNFENSGTFDAPNDLPW